MRHHSKIKKFGREKDQRNALMKSLALALVEREKIQTTTPKAKALRPLVEKMITKGKAGTLASRRLLVSSIGEAGAKKICDTLSPKYKERAGGYTRITKLPSRTKDAADMAQIEFV